MVSFALTIMAGLLRAETIEVGELRGAIRVPAVNFYINSGEQSHPAWAVNRGLAIELFAWKTALTQLQMEDAHVSISAAIVSDVRYSVVVATNFRFFSSPQARSLANRMISEMNKPGAKIDLPDRELSLPINTRRLLEAARKHNQQKEELENQ